MFYPLILKNDIIYRDGVNYHEKELFRFQMAFEQLGKPNGLKVLDIGSYPGTAHAAFKDGLHNSPPKGVAASYFSDGVI